MFNIREMRLLFCLVFVAFLAAAFFGAPTMVGVSVMWSGAGDYRFSAGTGPLELVFSVVILGLYVLLLQAPPSVPGELLPGIARRYFAFWIDFIFATMLAGPVAGILPVFVEWKRTQELQWSFERLTPLPGDTSVALIGVLFSTVVTIFYFALPLMRGKPTPGACIAHYQVVADDGNPMKLKAALLRTLLGILATAGAIFAPFFGRDREHGKFWLDKICNTHAVKPQ